MPIIIVDRRRMRRKLTFWRVLAVLVAVVAVVGGGAVADRAAGPAWPSGRRHRSRAITITGLIRSDQERVEALERLGEVAAPRR